jgi:hypothetical protein
VIGEKLGQLYVLCSQLPVATDVLALAWPERHGFGFPKSEAGPFGFGWL